MKRTGQKPKNSPGRKNDRRIAALARRIKEGASKQEIANIQAKILPPAVARAVRTKKDRSAKAKFFRG